MRYFVELKRIELDVDDKDTDVELLEAVANLFVTDSLAQAKLAKQIADDTYQAIDADTEVYYTYKAFIYDTKKEKYLDIVNDD